MSATEYPVNHPLAVKLWRKTLMQEALKQTWMSKFIGDDSNSLCQVFDETSKNAGDKITVGLRMQLTGQGVQGDATLEGNEESLTTYTDSLFIDQIRHAVRSAGKMSEQRVPFSVRDEGLQGLKDWWAAKFDTAFFNQLCGNTSAATIDAGNNTPTAATTNRKLFPNSETTEGSLSTGANWRFTLSLLDKAVAIAKTASPQIRPIRIEGGDHYVCFLDPWQVQDLRANTATGEWQQLQQAALQGGEVTNNPLFTGALGMYGGVILHETTRLTTFTTTGGYRGARALFCGAQSAAIGYGRNNSVDRMTWVEKLFDFGNQLGVAAGCIFGMKKLVFNSEDFGVITMSTTAEQS